MTRATCFRAATIAQKELGLTPRFFYRVAGSWHAIMKTPDGKPCRLSEPEDVARVAVEMKRRAN